MNNFTVLADMAASPQGNIMQTFVMVGVALLFFYFILLRPEQKRKKAMEAQRAAMQIGNKVIAMNIVGTLESIQDQTVTLRMNDGSKIEVLKMAITDVKAEEKNS
jgi:preprotein translocase subunit YajC